MSSFRSSVLLLGVLAAAASANTIGYFTTVNSTDFTTSSIGLRDIGAGTLNVSGISGSVTRAYLYWHGPTNSSNPNANSGVTVNSSAVSGTNIGFSDDNFWGADNSQAYRADVTSLITGNGNYALANFMKPDAMINGAALFVFYDDGNSANNRDVVLFNGNDANFENPFDPAGWNITLAGVNYSSGTAALTMYVSDGQDFGPSDDGTIRVNGTSIATGGIFQGLSPRVPGAGVSNGSLTDINTYDISSLLTPGLNNLNITLDEGFSDALSAVVIAVDLPAGAAPPPPTQVPEPSSVLLVGAGVGALAWRRYRA